VRKVSLAGVTLACAVIAGAGTAAASDADVVVDARACAAISASDARLQCFDLLVGKHNLNAPLPAEIKSVGSWEVTEDKSPIDDSKINIAQLVATNVSGSSNRDSAFALLSVRCREAVFEVYLTTSDIIDFAGTDPQPVLVRIGAQTARQERWASGTGGKTVGLWGSDGSKGAAFVKEIMGSDNPSLVIRTNIYNGATITAQFDISGAESTLEPILALCSGNPPGKKK
jgi:hypothetical protein